MGVVNYILLLIAFFSFIFYLLKDEKKVVINGKVYSKKRVLIEILLFIVITSIVFKPTIKKKIANSKANLKVVDLMLVVDLSASMWCTDVKPYRLKAAVTMLEKLITTGIVRNVGLVGFAGVASVGLPSTVDKDAVIEFLNQIEPEDIPQGGTNIVQALEYAYYTLPKDKNKLPVVVLITDGEDTTGEKIDYLKELYAKRGITLIVVGVGTSKGAPVPIVEAKTIIGYKKWQGKVAVSSLNKKYLDNLADQFKGYSIYLTNSDEIDNIARVLHDLLYKKAKMKQVKVDVDLQLVPYLAVIGFILTIILMF